MLKCHPIVVLLLLTLGCGSDPRREDAGPDAGVVTDAGAADVTLIDVPSVDAAEPDAARPDAGTCLLYTSPSPRD